MIGTPSARASRSAHGFRRVLSLALRILACFWMIRFFLRTFSLDARPLVAGWVFTLASTLVALDAVRKKARFTSSHHCLNLFDSGGPTHV